MPLLFSFRYDIDLFQVYNHFLDMSQWKTPHVSNFSTNELVALLTYFTVLVIAEKMLNLVKFIETQFSRILMGMT